MCVFKHQLTHVFLQLTSKMRRDFNAFIIVRMIIFAVVSNDRYRIIMITVNSMCVRTYTFILHTCVNNKTCMKRNVILQTFEAIRLDTDMYIEYQIQTLGHRSFARKRNLNIVQYNNNYLY